MKRILIVNVNWLGDTLFVAPFIKAIREAYPDSYIVVLTHPRCRQVLESNPHINEIIIYDEKGEHSHLLAKFSIVSRLKSKKFDTAFILRKSLSRTMLLFVSKIPERIGYDSKRAGFLLTRRIPLPSEKMHKVEYFLNLAEAIGVFAKDTDYEFFISEEDISEANQILKGAGIKENEDFIVINPGGNWNLKRWPVENFARLGDEIFNRLDKKVVLTGSEKDVDLCKHIFSLMKNKPMILSGKTSLKTLAAVLERAKCVISNDSGPMHIAVGVKTPVVALFGPTSPQITGPWGDGVYTVLQKKFECEVPCYKLSCKDNKCMRLITVEDVLEAIKSGL